MEIEIKPISLNDRLKYIQQVTENQEINAKKFPWGIAIASCLLGVIACSAVIYFHRRKGKEKNKM